MTSGLSALDRSTRLKEMSDTRLDLLVIGGGITGAGIAWDASVRSIKTGLIEMNDFASGTSSRSTKLLYSGLKYLKQGDYRLAKEAVRERAMLYRSAPHLIEPIPMLLPIYKKGAYGYWGSSVRLWICDRWARAHRIERRRMFRQEAVREMEPLIKSEGLSGSAYYYEYRTDDARLTMEILKSAGRHGAMIANYVKAEEFIYRAGRIAGVRAVDQLSGKVFTIHAKKIVNAAGPWSEELREKDFPLHHGKPSFSKGIHVVVDHRRLPVRHAVHFEARDGRMVYIIPRGRKTYIGSTDTFYKGDMSEPDITREDRQYLLDAVNCGFSGVHLKNSDIEAAWAGVCPLPKGKGGSPSELMQISDSGLITLSGGRLSAFRSRAEQIVDLAARKLQEEYGTIYPPCTTDRKTISGGIPENSEHKEYHDFKKAVIKIGRTFGIDIDFTLDLLSRYGSNTEKIFLYYKETPPEEPAGQRLLQAELAYSVSEEMTVNAVDFLLRRTGWMLFDRKRAERLMAHIVEEMAVMLGWNEDDRQRQWSLLEAAAQKVWQPDYQLRKHGTDEDSGDLLLEPPYEDPRYYA